MLVGKIFYNKQYSWYKYVSVALVCMGISLFTSAKSRPKESDHAPPVDSADMFTTMYGLLLVMINLSLDGVTSNEQDHIFAEHGATSLQMMKYTNAWQAIYLSSYLILNLIVKGSQSALYKSSILLLGCPELKYDILSFCFCACLGHVLLFGLIREFGSLVWITVSVTRQLFTILLSVFLFHHPVNRWQWIGVVSVFGGLGFEIFFSYKLKKPEKKEEDEGKLRTESVESCFEDSELLGETKSQLMAMDKDKKRD
jgi:UDP-galactose transporter B1